MLRLAGMDGPRRHGWGFARPTVANASSDDLHYSEVARRMRQIVDLMDQVGEMTAGLTEIVQTLVVQVQHLDAAMAKQAGRAGDQAEVTFKQTADWSGF